MLLSCSGIENTEVKRIDFPAKATHFDRFVFGERSTRMSVCCVTLTFNFLQVKVAKKLHWLRNVSNYSFEPGILKLNRVFYLFHSEFKLQCHLVRSEVI